MAQVDAGIPLSFRGPDVMNPAQMLSLQHMVQQMQADKLQQAQTLQTIGKQQKIQQIASDPSSIGPNGLLSLDAINKIRGIDWQTGEAAEGKRIQLENSLNQQKAFEAQTKDVELKRAQARQSLLSEVLQEDAVAWKQAEKMPEDRRMAFYNEAHQKSLQRRRDSGLWSAAGLSDDDYQRHLVAPSPEIALGASTSLKEIGKERKYEERDVPLKGDMIQKEYREGPNEPWKPLGTPSHKFSKQAETPGMGSTQSVVPEKDRDKHGEDFIKTLPPGIASEVKAVAEYRAPPSALGIRGPQREALIQRVTQYDPNWDFTTYPARQTVRRDFTSGTAAKNITAINTALGHIGTMDEMSKAVASGDIQTLNKAMNRLRSETGNPTINNYEIATSAVANELMRVFRQVGASETETQEWQKRFSAALTPDQKAGAIRTAAELLQSRIDAIDEQWKRGMGTDKPFPSLLTPKAKGVLDKVVGTKDMESGAITKPYSPSGSQALQYDDPEKERRYQEWKKQHGG